MPDLGTPASIAVLRALQLGDMLCAVPALRALRRAYPRARITLIGLPWARAFTERYCHYLDDFLEFPGYPGLPERAHDASAVAAFLATAQARQFDLALQLHGNGRIVNPLTQRLGARKSAGFRLPHGYCPDPGLFLPWQAAEHEVVRYVRLLSELGVPAQGLELEFPLSGEDRTQFEAIARGHALQAGRFVCLHAGSQLPSRRWPAKRFAAVGDAFSRRGYRVALTGTGSESALTRSVAAAMRMPSIDLAGATSLGALAMLIGQAAAVVCNDTGISHMAAALGTPSVVVSCGADPARWAPLDRERHRVLFRDVECRPCAYQVCPFGHPCATGVSVQAVLAAAQELPGIGAAGRGGGTLPRRFAGRQFHGARMA
jgi:ADP-heptose:LPS heptosyltransferase